VHSDKTRESSDEELQRLKQKAEESHRVKGSRRFTKADAEYADTLIRRWFFASAAEIHKEKLRAVKALYLKAGGTGLSLLYQDEENEG